MKRPTDDEPSAPLGEDDPSHQDPDVEPQSPIDAAFDPLQATSESMESEPDSDEVTDTPPDDVPDMNDDETPVFIPGVVDDETRRRAQVRSLLDGDEHAPPDEETLGEDIVPMGKPLEESPSESPSHETSVDESVPAEEIVPIAATGLDDIGRGGAGTSGPVPVAFGEMPIGASRIIKLGLWLVILAGLVTWITFSVVHIDTRFNCESNVTPNAWLARAHQVQNGALYPPLYDETTGQIGGTRYMPLNSLLHVAAARSMDGDLLAGAKLATAVNMGFLLLTLFIGLYLAGCPKLLAGALTAFVLITPLGMIAATRVTGDSLAVALQLMALLLVARATPASSTGRFIGAALLCALAVLCKISAIWALGTIGIWLLLTNRRALLFFAGSFVIVTGLGILLLWLAGGAFFGNLGALLFAGSSGAMSIVVDGPSRLVEFGDVWIPGFWTITAVVLLGVLMRLTDRQFTVVHLAFIVCLLVQCVIFADVGAGENHLLAPLALALLIIGDLLRSVRREAGVMMTTDALVAAVIIAFSVVPFVASVRVGNTLQLPSHATALADTIGIARGDDLPEVWQRDPLRGVLPDDAVLFSEDPWLPIVRNQSPVVLDGFMLPRVAEREPAAIEQLRARIESHAFDAIVLTQKIDDQSKAYWYSRLMLGSDVVASIEAAYAPRAESVNGYWIYEPTPRPTEPSAEE